MPGGKLLDNARVILRKRYMDPKDREEEDVFRRCDLGNREYRDMLLGLYALPNSPTLFNLGTGNNGTLSACFPASTVIHCLAGDFTVAEILAKGWTKFEVFSTDGEHLRIGRAFGLRKTKSNARLYRVRFDTGQVIKLTADHLVMMRDGSYKEVRHLRAGDSVMPFNYSYQKYNAHLRRFVCPRINDRRVPAYRWAFAESNGRRPANANDIHHKDHDPMNDSSDNLEELTNAEHASRHISADNPMWRPEVAAKISRQMKGNKRGVGPKPGTAAAMKGNTHAVGTVWTPERREAHRRRMMGNTRRRDAASRERGEYNHKVVSVKFCGREDVYDLSVHKYHNFAADGVFIHNCFVFDIADSLYGDEFPAPDRPWDDSIIGTMYKAAAVAKAGGGVGYYFGNLRPRGAEVQSVHRKACGPVEVLKFKQRLAKLITQGGKRDLAQMGVLPRRHPDVLEWITCKDDDPAAIGSFNISVDWADDELARVDWDLVKFAGLGTIDIDPKQDNEDSYVWWKHVSSAWNTGCPGILFGDAINRANATPHLGRVNATNPCGETPNLSDEPCLDGGSMVDTPEGLIPIRQLLGRGEFSVVTHDQVVVTGCRAVTRGVKKTMRFVLSTGQTIRCTHNHKILTNGGWVRADELAVGSLVRIADKQTVNPVLRESLVDEMLGWQLGDGWFSRDNSLGILFAEDDLEAMDRLMPVWDEFVGFDYALQVQPTGVRQKSTEKVAVIDKFRSLGFKVGIATKKRLPTYLFTAQPHQQAAFLRGLFSADGHVKMAGCGLRNLVTLASSSRKLLREVQTVLLRFGIQSRIQWSDMKGAAKKRNPQGMLQISGASALRYMDVIGFNLSKKTEAFDYGAKHRHNNKECVKVVMVRHDAGDTEVFDVLMPAKHHFIANGVVVHNCNLGSLFLYRFLRHVPGPSRNRWEIDWLMLEQFARLFTRYLDDVLDANQFPHPAITKAAYLTRKLGMGCGGWADLLAYLRVPYASADAVALADELWGKVNGWALDESIKLADRKGPYPAWESAPPEVKARFPRARNSTRTSIAPTGTIAIIAGAGSWSIEPHYALETERTTNEGIKMVERPQFVDDWGDWKPQVAAEVNWEWHIRHQAAFQKHADLGVSKTINLPHEATVKDFSDAYRLMWQLGCKGGTAFRDGCRSEQVLVDLSKKKASVYTVAFDPAKPGDDRSAATIVHLSVPVEVRAPVRRKLSPTRRSVTHRFKVGGTRGYVTVGLYDGGRPAEIFVRASKGGSAVNGMLDTWAMTFSTALQYGTPLADLVRLHRGQRFDPAGLTEHPTIRTATSIPDYIVRWMELEFLTTPGVAPSPSALADKPAARQKAGPADGPLVTGQLCPDCGWEMTYAEGCMTCTAPGCGYSRCG